MEPKGQVKESSIEQPVRDPKSGWVKPLRRILQGERKPVSSLSLSQNPAPSPQPDVFMAQKRQLKVLLSKILQPKLFHFSIQPLFGSPILYVSFLDLHLNNSNQTLCKPVLCFNRLFIFLCRFSLAPPSSHLFVPFLCSPLLVFLLIPLPTISHC